ncbi:MAG: hypothetical protein ACRYFU_05175 [Janthinobacterium lividum]
MAAWLQQHPGTEIISLDRGGIYAEAARRGAPQAVQVADRWHLLRNLSEALCRAIAPHHRFPTPEFGPPPAQLPAKPQHWLAGISLKHHAASCGMLYGCAVVLNGPARDPTLSQLLVDQSAILVPEGELKWRGLRPTQS